MNRKHSTLDKSSDDEDVNRYRIEELSTTCNSLKIDKDNAYDHNFLAYIEKLPNEIVQRIILYLTEEDLKELFMFFVSEHLEANNSQLTPIKDPLILKCLQSNSVKIWRSFQFETKDIRGGKFESMLYILDSILSENVKKNSRLKYYQTDTPDGSYDDNDKIFF